MSRIATIPSIIVGLISTYIPHSVRPEIVPSNVWPTLSVIYSMSLYLMLSRSALAAICSRSEAWTHWDS